jgi:hypothetical protein
LEKQKWLVYVMVYDMILADGIKGSGHFKKLLLKYKNPLVQALVRMKVRYHLTHVCCACACAVVRVRVCGVCGVCANHAAMQGKGGRQ